MIPSIYTSNAYPQIRGNSYRTTKIKKTNYGYFIKRFSDFVSIQTIKLHVLNNGFSYAIVKVETNYRPTYQYRLYFDNKGKEYISTASSDAQEKKDWLNEQKKPNLN